MGKIVLAQIRIPLIVLGWIGIGVNAFHSLGGLFWGAVFCLFAGIACSFAKPGNRVEATPFEVRSPVAGRWIPVNSPKDRVPSHCTHAYGQTYAIDLLHKPEGHVCGPIGWRPVARRPETFPSFGRPILAPADGVVVKTGGRQRDHRSRRSIPGIIYLMFEGIVREVFGPRFLFGNHVVLDLGNGVYAAFAHLKRGSLLVEKGQRVSAGRQLASCGNSGNSSEPHLHFQLMDGPSLRTAGGLPFSFGFEPDGSDEIEHGVPSRSRAFVAV